MREEEQGDSIVYQEARGIVVGIIKHCGNLNKKIDLKLVGICRREVIGSGHVT